MSRMFLVQLLGFWLVLSQPSSAGVRDAWLMEVIKVCGREFARTVIDVCGQTSFQRMALSQEKRALDAAPPAEIVPSYINKDAKPLNMMLEFIPNLPQEPKAMLSERRSLLLERQQEYVPVLKDSNLSFEEFKKNFHNRQDEAEDSSPSELKYLGLDTHSRKKRQSEMLLGQRCCQVGCTRRSIAEFC